MSILKKCLKIKYWSLPLIVVMWVVLKLWSKSSTFVQVSTFTSCSNFWKLTMDSFLTKSFFIQIIFDQIIFITLTVSIYSLIYVDSDNNFRNNSRPVRMHGSITSFLSHLNYTEQESFKFFENVKTPLIVVGLWKCGGDAILTKNMKVTIYSNFVQKLCIQIF